MTRNNRLLLITLAALVAILSVIKWTQSRRGAETREAIVLYLLMPHPYFTAVQAGGEAFAREHRVPVRILVGQESSQGNLNTNIESMSTLGYKAFSLYPVDPAGSKGLFSQLRRAGRLAVAYGAEPEAGTQTAFAVATDTRTAATLAAEKLVELLGKRGRILNVLEGSTDANTPVRKAAIEAVVARHPRIQIIQTIGDVTTEQKAREKIESALVARGDDIDGIICTGYTTTVAGSVLLSEHHAKPGAKRIHFVGLDTDERVLGAIRSGAIDATVAQNPFGHGYITCALLDRMQHGWEPRQPYQFVDSGAVMVTRENVDTFQGDVERTTQRIVAELTQKYLKQESTK